MPILLADDHEGVRTSFTWRIKRFAEVVATATVDETLAALRARNDWRGFVFDVRFGPDDDQAGLRLLTEARSLFPEVPAFLVTAFVDPDLILRAAALDARCWPKSIGPEHFEQMAKILERERERERERESQPHPNRAAPTPSRHRQASLRTSTLYSIGASSSGA